MVDIDKRITLKSITGDLLMSDSFERIAKMVALLMIRLEYLKKKSVTGDFFESCLFVNIHSDQRITVKMLHW